ncbi:hypothetical protein BDN71DRAFT_443101 [Pleurotus eryngii]|uniref:Uncharacterized protein n=1 Tax=Pleurotus eryngii TaxID=5323 RepID=A0A9P6A2P9_PLEER|nr:hypothetical protein BDN71DRAFT_443101 [Pleurotus eryngii]
MRRLVDYGPQTNACYGCVYTVSGVTTEEGAHREVEVPTAQLTQKLLPLPGTCHALRKSSAHLPKPDPPSHPQPYLTSSTNMYVTP